MVIVPRARLPKSITLCLARALTASWVLLATGCLSSDVPNANQTAAETQASSQAASSATSPRTNGAPVSPASSPCRASGSGVVAEMALARCLADAPLPATRSGPERPVVLYLDRSGSMRGFLDPDYPARTRTDFRSVLDRIVVGLKPARAFSYGVALRQIDPSLGVVGNKAFYEDRDTRLEDVVTEVERDTASAATHIIIGDARRGSPDVANGQFVRLRAAAERWVKLGGTVLVATSLAPFKTVPTDPSGCRQGQGSGGEPQTCPLYAFVYVAPGEELRIASAVADVFEHVFAWPALRLPPDALTLTGPATGTDIMLERHWESAPDGAPVARVSGRVATNKALSARVALRDTTSLIGRTYAALLAGQHLAFDLRSRALTPEAGGQDWGSVDARGALVHPVASASPRLDFVTRGPAAPRSIVRVDLVATGEPSWLSDFDAVNAGDVIRTYGLGRLFEASRQDASRTAPVVARLYVVVN